VADESILKYFLMFDFDIEILQDNDLISVNFAKYVANKTVLVCPGINNMHYPTLDYYNYVHGLLDSYKLDEVLLINHTDDVFFHMHIGSHFPEFTTVTDRKQNYIKELKQNKQMQSSQSELATKWAYQQLLRHGKEQGFWDQPLSDQWKHFLRKKDAIKAILQAKSAANTPRSQTAKVLQKLHKTQEASDIYNLTAINWLKVSEEGLTLLRELGPLVYYFNLYKNAELESLLPPIDKKLP